MNGGIPMKRSLTFVTLFVLTSMVTRIGASPVQYAQTSVPAGTTYTWHGELVSLDQTSRALTVKAMVAGSALEELMHFKAGDRIMLGWSGFDKYANAIN